MLLSRLNDVVWSPWLLGLFLAAGLYYSLRTGFFQLFRIPLWLRTTFGAMLRRRGRGNGRGISQFQALATALASTIGTGSIAGVATAIWFGGPGAVFWMWVSAFLSMMTGCLEKILAVRYREPSPEGGWQGGPMCYMEHGLGSRGLACLFSLCCVGASLGGGTASGFTSGVPPERRFSTWAVLLLRLFLPAITHPSRAHPDGSCGERRRRPAHHTDTHNPGRAWSGESNLRC